VAVIVISILASLFLEHTVVIWTLAVGSLCNQKLDAFAAAVNFDFIRRRCFDIFISTFLYCCQLLLALKITLTILTEDIITSNQPQAWSVRLKELRKTCEHISRSFFLNFIAAYIAVSWNCAALFMHSSMHAFDFEQIVDLLNIIFTKKRPLKMGRSSVN